MTTHLCLCAVNFDILEGEKLRAYFLTEYSVLNQKATEDRNISSLLYNHNKDNASFSKESRALRDCMVRVQPARALCWRIQAAGCQLGLLLQWEQQNVDHRHPEDPFTHRRVRAHVHTHTPAAAPPPPYSASTRHPQNSCDRSTAPWPTHTVRPLTLEAAEQLRSLGRAPQKQGSPLSSLFVNRRREVRGSSLTQVGTSSSPLL